MRFRNSCILIILVLLTISLRLPFTSKYLYFVDSVIYSLSMEKFDISHGIPAAPGCFGYVILGKFIRLFTHEANRSLVWIGILFSALSSGMGYLLGKEMYGRRNGLITALLLLTSPLVWFFGEIAMPVISNLFFSMLVAFFSYRAMTSNKLSPLIFSAIALGLGAAFRQDLLIFIFPLWLWSIRRRSIREVMLGLSVLILTSFIWLIPSSFSCGGLIPYLALCRERIFGQAGHFSYITPRNIFFKKMHLGNYFLALFTASFLGIVPMVSYLGRFFNPRTIIRDSRTKFLIVWILPALIYMNLVGGNRSYIFVHLLAIFLYLSAALETIYHDFREGGFVRLGRLSLLIAVVLILGVNIFFFSYDPHPEKRWTGNTWFRLSDIRKHDQLLEGKLNYIKNHFSPEDSIILAGGPRQTYWPVFYYLPSYKVYQPNAVYWPGAPSLDMAFHHQCESIPGPVFRIPGGIKNIIFFDEDIYPYIKAPAGMEKIEVGSGYAIYLLPSPGKRNIKLGLHSLEVW